MDKQRGINGTKNYGGIINDKNKGMSLLENENTEWLRTVSFIL